MDSADLSAYFRWPSRDGSWSTLAWLLLIPKAALLVVAWAVGIALILVAVFAPAALVVLMVEAIDLPAIPAVAAVGAAFVATLYVAATVLDL